MFVFYHVFVYLCHVCNIAMSNSQMLFWDVQFYVTAKCSCFFHKAVCNEGVAQKPSVYHMCMCIYIYMYTYVTIVACISAYIHIYIYT